MGPNTKRNDTDDTSSVTKLPYEDDSDERFKKLRFHPFRSLREQSFINGCELLSSNLPQEQLIPNSFHENFFKKKWQLWQTEIPEWMNRTGEKILNEYMNTSKQTEIETYNGEDQMEGEILDKYNIASKRKTQLNIIFEDNREGNEHGISELRQKDNINVKKFEEWSLELTKGGRLVISMKVNMNASEFSRDVSCCKRIDQHTLLHPNGTIYKLIGQLCSSPEMPFYVENKFKSGFPDDWLIVKSLWQTYKNQGCSPDFQWADCQQNNTSSPDKNIALQSNKKDLTSLYHIPKIDEKCSKDQTKVDENSIMPTHLNSQSVKVCQTKEISLSRWTPIFVDKNILKIRGTIMTRYESPLCHTTDEVKCRKGKNSFMCKDGNYYMLRGPYEDPNNELPDLIKPYLKNGFPIKWKVMLTVWADIFFDFKAANTEGSKRDLRSSKEPINLQKESINIRRSNAGQLLFPPLRQLKGAQKENNEIKSPKIQMNNRNYKRDFVNPSTQKSHKRKSDWKSVKRKQTDAESLTITANCINPSSGLKEIVTKRKNPRRIASYKRAKTYENLNWRQNVLPNGAEEDSIIDNEEDILLESSSNTEVVTDYEALLHSFNNMNRLVSMDPETPPNKRLSYGMHHLNELNTPVSSLPSPEWPQRKGADVIRLINKQQHLQKERKRNVKLSSKNKTALKTKTYIKDATEYVDKMFRMKMGNVDGSDEFCNISSEGFHSVSDF